MNRNLGEAEVHRGQEKILSWEENEESRDKKIMNIKPIVIYSHFPKK